MNATVKKLLLLFVGVLFLFVFLNLFVLNAKPAKKITLGVTFSQAQAEFLKLDWKKAYLATLEDLQVKNIKIMTNWDFIEPKKDSFDFTDTDWQVSQAQGHGADVVYVLGMKTGRWPECHVPSFILSLSKDEQQKALLDYVQESITHYKDQKNIIAWQAENEPLFRFGICPWYDSDFLAKEVQLIKSLDTTRPVIISDSGEQSFWFKAASIGDIVGTTLYRKVWFHVTDQFGFYVNWPFSPKSYWLKAQVIEKIFHKKVINVELQAEPWFPKVFLGMPLEQQEKVFNEQTLQDYMTYAKNTGFDTFYFWGTEWWYWMKEKNNKPAIWNEAKILFSNY